jgi:WD40 repeat protein
VFDAPSSALLKEDGTGWGEIKYSPDGNLLLVDAMSAILIFDPKSLQKVSIANKSERSLIPSGPEWIRGGRAFAAADDDGVLIGLADGKVERRISGIGGIRRMAISPDGERILTAGADGAVRLFDARSGEQLADFRGHAGPVDSVALSPDGRLAASGGRDRTVRLWQLPRP